jgi:hypothetical protein
LDPPHLGINVFLNCEAFISSQRHEGWVCLPKAYDDGGFPGATMDRPALQQPLPPPRISGILIAQHRRRVLKQVVEIGARGSAQFGDVAEPAFGQGGHHRGKFSYRIVPVKYLKQIGF